MWRDGTDARAVRLYRYSITYLTALFALIILDVFVFIGRCEAAPAPKIRSGRGLLRAGRRVWRDGRIRFAGMRNQRRRELEAAVEALLEIEEVDVSSVVASATRC